MIVWRVTANTRAVAVTEFLVSTLGLADPDVTQTADLSVRSMLEEASKQIEDAFETCDGEDALCCGRNAAEHKPVAAVA